MWILDEKRLEQQDFIPYSWCTKKNYTLDWTHFLSPQVFFMLLKDSKFLIHNLLNWLSSKSSGNIDVSLWNTFLRWPPSSSSKISITFNQRSCSLIRRTISTLYHLFPSRSSLIVSHFWRVYFRLRIILTLCRKSKNKKKSSLSKA